VDKATRASYRYGAPFKVDVYQVYFCSESSLYCKRGIHASMNVYDCNDRRLITGAGITAQTWQEFMTAVAAVSQW
jgi:hypothetical protein